MTPTSPCASSMRASIERTPRAEKSSLSHSHPTPNRASPHRASPHRARQDGPADQLLEEFGRLLIDKDLNLKQRLDKESAEQDQVHKIALAKAAAEHERVRNNAERARERVELEIERERKRREDEAQRALEIERQAKVQREHAELKRQKDALQREAEERERRQNQEREVRETTARLEEQERKDHAEAEERRRRDSEAAKQRASQAAEAAKARLQAANATAATAPTSSPTNHQTPASQPVSETRQNIQPPAQNATTSTVQADREAVHKKYLALHMQLKQMRNFVVKESSKIPAVKAKLSDWRREIVKCMGQLTFDKTQNRKPLTRIMTILKEAQNFTEPSVDVSQYLISHPSPSSPLLVSGPFIYLINIFTKSVISQFISETSGGAKSADPVGVVAVTILATPAYKLNQTIPLIDILLAKFHVVCPVLWGIHGPSNKEHGRERLGWWKEDGSWISEQRHIERMSGLAAGYASLSLRDFSKSKNVNPFPNTHYWHAMAAIVKVPGDQLQGTHLTVLRGLIDGFVPRFIGFYGQAAVAVLRLALVDVPDRARRTGNKNLSSAADQVDVLRELIRRDLRLTL